MPTNTKRFGGNDLTYGEEKACIDIQELIVGIGRA